MPVVAKRSQIAPGTTRKVEAGGVAILLCNVDGSVYAIEDVCTHDGGPLGEGFLEGFTIACPRHGAKFDIRDGRVLCMPAVSGTNSHEVKVEDGEVFVKLVDRPKKNYVM